jgi:serine/threonine protein kinase
MGAVYRALDPNLQRRVALKVLKPEAMDAVDGAKRLLREARAVAAFSHPNAVSVFDVGVCNGCVYIVMEYLQGQTLRDALSGPPVPWQTRLEWLSGIARALGAAHRAGIVHRDVKPENVMIGADGMVKVLDFGVARHVQGTPSPTAATALVGLSTLTEAGAMVGTPLYMAPEQLQGIAVDGRADQFAWGVIAYEAFAGIRPWGTPVSVYALIAAMLGEEPKPLRLAESSSPSWLSDVVARTLARDPALRYPTMDGLLDALRAAAEQSLSATQPLPLRASAPPASSAAARALREAKQLFHDGAGYTGECALQRCLDLEQETAAAHLRVALRLLDRSPGKAREHYQKAFQFRASLDSFDSALLHASEPYLRAHGDLSEWQQRLELLVERAPDYEARLWLATALEKQGKHEAALSVLDRALELDDAAIPVWSAKGRVLLALDRREEALRAFEQGLALSPSGADCLQERIRLFIEVGDCERVEADAQAWVAIEPRAPRALYALAEALASRAAPYESVEAVLARRWLHPAGESEAEDKLDLALLRGDFEHAEQILLEWHAGALGSATSVTEWFHPTLGLLSVYAETGRNELAGRTAAECLARLPAFSADPLGSDPTLRLLRHMLRGGQLSPEAYGEQRARWLNERARTHGLSVSDWLNGYVVAVDSVEDAEQALAALTSFPALPKRAWPSHLNALVGKVRLLAGDAAGAAPLLERAACACAVLSTPLIHFTASYYFGLARKQLGDSVGARRALESIVQRWGSACPASVTATKAAAVLLQLEN